MSWYTSGPRCAPFGRNPPVSPAEGDAEWITWAGTATVVGGRVVNLDSALRLGRTGTVGVDLLERLHSPWRGGRECAVQSPLASSRSIGRLSVFGLLSSVKFASSARAWEGDSPRSCVERRRSSHRSPAA